MKHVWDRVCTDLKAAGHDAVHVGEIGLTSTDDLMILDRARDEDRYWSPVITIVRDKYPVRVRDNTRPSVVLVRGVDALPSAELAALLLAALPGQLTELLLAGAIATLTPGRVRVRPLPAPAKHRRLTFSRAHASLSSAHPRRGYSMTSDAA